MIDNLIIKRGDMFRAVFDGVGSEQAGERPFVVLQNNLGNKYSPTLIVALITTKIKRDMPTHVNLTKEFGLKEESVVMLEQIRTIDRSRIIENSYIGRVSRETMKLVDEAMSISVALESSRDSEVRKQVREIEYWERSLNDLMDDIYATGEQIKQRVIKLKIEYNKLKEMCYRSRLYLGDYYILDEFKYESMLRNTMVKKAKVLQRFYQGARVMFKSVEKIVTEEVFPLFAKGRWKEGKEILKRLSFEITDNHSIEEKRLVYYNYAWVLHEVKEKELAKKYTIIIKNIIENDEEYMETNEEKYYKVLNLYDQLLTEEIKKNDDDDEYELLTEEEIKMKEKLYMKSYLISKDNINYLDQAFMAKADLYFLKKDYLSVAYLCDQIHSYKFHKVKNGEVIPADMLDKLHETQKKIMKKLKKRDEKVFNELIEELSLTSDNSSITNMQQIVIQIKLTERTNEGRREYE